MTSGIVRTSISLPKDLIKELDRFVDSTRSDRSKVIQQAIRNFLSIPHEEDEKVAGSLMIVYNHEEHGLEEDITDIQHDFMDLIISNLHIHLDKERCMVAIFVKGNLKNIQSLMRSLTGRRGVLMLKDSLLKLGN
ncbi:MAG: CopG family ribbon-helix-helix protein [Thermoproteota archaeon]